MFKQQGEKESIQYHNSKRGLHYETGNAKEQKKKKNHNQHRLPAFLYSYLAVHIYMKMNHTFRMLDNKSKYILKNDMSLKHFFKGKK